ncbi:MAG: 16S rRNA processing protein RimM [Rikenellaceae bacterium]|nr:16S rRNA processing protein RimM [Rikenellaceae bacterium]MCL2691980.1 16S rRNA processing protein RimM [Rikenellaceae bacterium]
MLLPAGKIVKLFGHDGTVVINLYDAFHECYGDDGDNIENNETPLFVKIDGLAVPLFIERFERRGQRGALIRFADIDTPARAEELLVGHELFVAQEDTERENSAKNSSENDDIFFGDLVGYRALIAEEDSADEPLAGAVVAFIDHALNPLLQLDIDGNEVLVPAIGEFITAIDPARRTVELILPVGLLELYL